MKLMVHCFWRFFLLILPLLVVMFGFSTGFSASKVEINQGSIRPSPVVVVPIFAASSDSVAVASQLNQLIIADLAATDLFTMVDGSQYAEKGLQEPIYANWTTTSANFILKGVLGHEGNTYTLRIKLWNAITHKQVASHVYTFTDKETSSIAHDVADIVYHAITGERGYFNTTIVYIDEAGSFLDRLKRVALMHYNGDNPSILSLDRNPDTISLTPRFSPDGRYIVYTVLNRRTGVELYLYDVVRRSAHRLGNFPTMTFSPRFSPDSKFLLFCMATGANTDIYELNLRTGSIKRLTRTAAIEVSPSYSPDGKSIVFASDRTGVQQLYVMDRDGGNVRRISFGETGYYATPSWSPRGDLIAFTRYYQDAFYIGVMSPTGANERFLTKSYSAESPSWSPNGRRLVFYGAEHRADHADLKLYSIDITGIGRKRLATPNGASDPDWAYQPFVTVRRNVLK